MVPIERSPLARALGALVGGVLGALVAIVWVLPVGFHPAMWLLPVLGALSGGLSGDRGIKRLARIISLD